jgi:hypothetical protein
VDKSASARCLFETAPFGGVDETSHFGGGDEPAASRSLFASACFLVWREDGEDATSRSMSGGHGRLLTSMSSPFHAVVVVVAGGEGCFVQRWEAQQAQLGCVRRQVMCIYAPAGELILKFEVLEAWKRTQEA